MKNLFHGPSVAVASALMAVFATSACVSVLPEAAPPAPRYVIESVTPATVAGAPVGWSLIIADPTTSQLYNTVKVALSREPNRFEFYQGAEWADRTPVLFERALIRSFENTERILNIGDFTALPISDYVLKTDIRAFHVDYTGGSPTVVVAVFARLTDRQGQIKAVRLFETNELVGADNVANIMAGFDAALGRVLTSIVVWGFEEGERAQSIQLLEASAS